MSNFPTTTEGMETIDCPACKGDGKSCRVLSLVDDLPVFAHCDTCNGAGELFRYK